MKLNHSDKEKVTFSLDQHERGLLFHILQFHPLVPTSHQPLSQGERGDAQHEDQQALEKALAEYRRENRQRVLALLSERFHQTAKGVYLSLTVPEIEWLLQALNDLRVGAWLALGRPEELKFRNINETNKPYVLAMEAAGYFQSELLTMLGYTEPPLPPDEA